MFGLLREKLPHVKESGFRNPGNFCIWNSESCKFLLVESGILGLGIRNTGVGIRNPSSTEKDLESSKWNPESTAWNPESKSVLDSLTWGEKRTGETDFSTSLIVLIQVYNWEMSGTTQFN